MAIFKNPMIQPRIERMRTTTRETIDQANSIIDEYQAQGFRLTLRQLFYQFVSRGFIENNQGQYNRLGKIVNDARRRCQIRMDAIEDRTRAISFSYDSGHVFHMSNNVDLADMLRSRIRFSLDLRNGVVKKACLRRHVPYLSTRGFCSLSTLYEAGQRFQRLIDNRFWPIVFFDGKAT
jgi:hypothetical protein